MCACRRCGHGQMQLRVCLRWSFSRYRAIKYGMDGSTQFSHVVTWFSFVADRVARVQIANSVQHDALEHALTFPSIHEICGTTCKAGGKHTSLLEVRAGCRGSWVSGNCIGLLHQSQLWERIMPHPTRTRPAHDILPNNVPPGIVQVWHVQHV